MIHRRSFLHTVLATGIAPYFVPASVLRSETAPSNKTTLGVIGCGAQGTGAAAKRVALTCQRGRSFSRGAAGSGSAADLTGALSRSVYILRVSAKVPPCE